MVTPRNDSSATRPIVIGAGIAGLTTALCLDRASPDRPAPVVLESAPRLTPLGVGLNLLPHAMRVFDALGLGPALADAGNPITAMSYHTRRGQRVLEEARGTSAGFRWPQVAIHRAALHGVLLDAVAERLPEGTVRLDSPAVAPDGSGAVRLTGTDPHHEDGLHAAVVVAADGIHSATRARMYPGEGDPIWNGIVMWRGTTLTSAPWGPSRMIVAGDHRQKFVAYPITRPDDTGRQVVNWVAETEGTADAPPPRWNHEVGPSLANAVFGDWEVDGVRLAPLIRSADRVVEYPMVDRDPVPTWNDGVVTLVGDAAHPMHPVGSNGASQAILDCAVLSHHLHTFDTVPDALRRYEEDRRPAAYAVVESNRAFRPEGLLRVVAERAPDGFDDLSDVVAPGELDELLAEYRATAGFDVEALNEGRTGIPVDHLT